MAAGDYALFWNFSGELNTAVGFDAMSNNLRGTANTAAGALAQTGVFGQTGGDENTAVGKEAGGKSVGNGNVSVGFRALPTLRSLYGYGISVGRQRVNVANVPRTKLCSRITGPPNLFVVSPMGAE